MRSRKRTNKIESLFLALGFLTMFLSIESKFSSPEKNEDKRKKVIVTRSFSILTSQFRKLNFLISGHFDLFFFRLW